MNGALPKLLVCDIDGTLVRSDKSLADATVAAVQRARARLPVTLISARPPSGIAWIAERLGLAGALGAFNGGTLFESDARILQSIRLGAAEARASLELITRADMTCWVFSDGGWFTTDLRDPHTPRETKAANVQPIAKRDFSDRLERIDKIVGVSDDHARLAVLEKEVIAATRGAATVARSQPYYLDVTASAANKGDGVAALATAFGVALADVWVIGDQMNDLPMFARAGLAIAMGQAPEAVKIKADLITRANDEDGVAYAIDTMIMPKLAAANGS